MADLKTIAEQAADAVGNKFTNDLGHGGNIFNAPALVPILLPFLAQARSAALEESAGVVEEFDKKTLAKQTGRNDYTSQMIDQNIRMTTVLFEDLATAIRTLKEEGR